ncbi:hypothetical protein Bca4012_101003 [Brassica carinata]
MEVSMSLNALARLPLKNTGRLEEVGLARHSLFTSRTACRESAKRGMVFVVEAKGKKGMAARQYQRTPPPMPKIEDDGNPRFVIFIRMANDEKEIQKTAIKQHRVLRTATEFRYGYKLVVMLSVLVALVSFPFTSSEVFGFQENGNMRAALSTSDVIELPTQDQLKTVLDKVKDFFGDAKESFGKISSLNSGADEESPDEKAKQV